MMKKIILLISLFLLIAVGWWAVGDFTGKENLRSAENAKAETAQGNQGEKYTSKMLGWIGIAHGGDPNKPETWDVINGIKVPPMPNESENNKTIGGIDINNNGVRDDVERAIVLEFGKDKIRLEEVMTLSSYERNMMVSKNADDINRYGKSVDCIISNMDRKSRLEMAKKINVVTHLQVNTEVRKSSYASALAGSISKPCRLWSNQHEN